MTTVAIEPSSLAWDIWDGLSFAAQVNGRHRRVRIERRAFDDTFPSVAPHQQTRWARANIDRVAGLVARALSWSGQ